MLLKEFSSINSLSHEVHCCTGVRNTQWTLQGLTNSYFTPKILSKTLPQRAEEGKRMLQQHIFGLPENFRLSFNGASEGSGVGDCDGDGDCDCNNPQAGLYYSQLIQELKQVITTHGNHNCYCRCHPSQQFFGTRCKNQTIPTPGKNISFKRKLWSVCLEFSTTQKETYNWPHVVRRRFRDVIFILCNCYYNQLTILDLWLRKHLQNR